MVHPIYSQSVFLISLRHRSWYRHAMPLVPDPPSHSGAHAAHGLACSQPSLEPPSLSHRLAGNLVRHPEAVKAVLNLTMRLVLHQSHPYHSHHRALLLRHLPTPNRRHLDVRGNSPACPCSRVSATDLPKWHYIQLALLLKHDILELIDTVHPLGLLFRKHETAKRRFELLSTWTVRHPT